MATLDDNIIQLIETTARQILAEAGKAASKPDYLLLWPDILSDAKAAADMLEKLDDCCTMTIAAGSSGASTVFSKYTADIITVDSDLGRQKLLGRIGRFDGMICVQPQLHLLKSLASLDDSDFGAFVVFQALMLDVDVKMAISPAARRAREKSAGQGRLESRIADIYNAVVLLGIDVDYSADNPIADVKFSKTETAVAEVKAKGKELVTEKEIVKQHGLGVQKIITDSNTIVTPLAKDKARELGMNIEIR